MLQRGAHKAAPHTYQCTCLLLLFIKVTYNRATGQAKQGLLNFGGYTVCGKVIQVWCLCAHCAMNIIPKLQVMHRLQLVLEECMTNPCLHNPVFLISWNCSRVAILNLVLFIVTF